MKLKNIFNGGEVFINKNGAIVVISKTTLDVNEKDFLVEYRISSSAAKYYDHNYEYQLTSEEAFIEMLKANNYIRI